MFTGTFLSIDTVYQSSPLKMHLHLSFNSDCIKSDTMHCQAVAGIIVFNSKLNHLVNIDPSAPQEKWFGKWFGQ